MGNGFQTKTTTTTTNKNQYDRMRTYQYYLEEKSPFHSNKQNKQQQLSWNSVNQNDG